MSCPHTSHSPSSTQHEVSSASTSAESSHLLAPHGHHHHHPPVSSVHYGSTLPSTHEQRRTTPIDNNIYISFGAKSQQWGVSDYVKEVTLQSVLLLVYLLLLGVTVSVPWMIQLTQYHLLIMVTLRVVHFLLVCAQCVRAAYWSSNSLSEQGFFYVSRSLRLSRRGPFLVVVGGSVLLSVALAWFKHGCEHEEEACVLNLNMHQTLQVFLGLEGFLVTGTWLLYLGQILAFLRHPRYQHPDVANQLWMERANLLGNSALEAGTLLAVSEVPPGTEEGDTLQQQQAHLIRCLQSQNRALSRRLACLTTPQPPEELRPQC